MTAEVPLGFAHRQDGDIDRVGVDDTGARLHRRVYAVQAGRRIVADLLGEALVDGGPQVRFAWAIVVVDEDDEFTLRADVVVAVDGADLHHVDAPRQTIEDEVVGVVVVAPREVEGASNLPEAEARIGVEVGIGACVAARRKRDDCIDRPADQHGRRLREPRQRLEAPIQRDCRCGRVFAVDELDVLYRVGRAPFHAITLSLEVVVVGERDRERVDARLKAAEGERAVRRGHGRVAGGFDPNDRLSKVVVVAVGEHDAPAEPPGVDRQRHGRHLDETIDHDRDGLALRGVVGPLCREGVHTHDQVREGVVAGRVRDDALHHFAGR